MKITKVQLSPDDRNITPSSTQKPADDFSSYLREILSQEKSESVGAVMANEISPSLSNDGLDSLLNARESFERIAENLNSAVDQLESIASLLGSPETDLRQIDDLVDVMAKLNFTSKDTTSTDTSLMSIEEEIKMCSFLESIKWKRGDYL
ncbi:MAG: hypothetical protein WHS38_07720 [Thermodesulforhabdaceae bacterium]